MTATLSIVGAALDFEGKGLICIAVLGVIVFLATSARRPSRRCPRCQEINRDGAVYCAQCGIRLPER